MGTSASYVIRRVADTWVSDVRDGVTAVELERLATPGPSIVARVLHSDVCFALGTAPGLPTWRWTFGEAAAWMYPVEFDPSLWFSTDDPDALEESRDARVSATATAVAAWAAAAGLSTPSEDEIARTLAAGHVFADEGLHDLLEVLRIDARLHDLGLPASATIGASGDDADEYHEAMIRVPRSRRDAAPKAVAIDRSSAWWAETNAYFLENRFGDPSAFLCWQGSHFILSDPPVSVGSGHTGLPDAWVTVPPRQAADFHAAAAWARSHVGEAGDPPTGTRPVLEIDDPPPRDRELDDVLRGRGLEPPAPPPWSRYRRADNAAVSIHLELAEPLEGGMAAELAHFTYERLVTATVASVGNDYSVTYGGDEAERGWGLLVGGTTLRPNGHLGLSKATATAWSRVVGHLRDGTLAGASFDIRRTDAFGRRWEPFSNMAATFRLWHGPRAEPGTPPRLLEIRAELPFFRHLLTSADAEALARSALTAMTLRRGHVHVGRWSHAADHWIEILPTSEATTDEGHAIVETHGDLTWRQRTIEPPSPVVEVDY